MESKNYLLTILIPTYNRGHYLRQLLRLFKESGVLAEDHRIQLVIANNCSKDSTLQVVAEYSDVFPNFKLLNYTEHVSSAEENVFRSFKNCDGEYTWILGDDDVPFFENLETVVRELETNVHDFLQHNIAVVGRKGKITSEAVLRMHNEKWTGDVRDLALHNGCWYVMAGMSNQILRTSLVRDFDFQTVTKIGLIYSHVTAYLLCFSGRVTTCFNYPIVWYKVIEGDNDHWSRAAKKHNVFTEYFWTLGWIRQIKFLIGKGILQKSDPLYLLEHNDRKKFRMLNTMHQKLFDQVKLGRISKDPREKMSESDFYEIYNFLLETNIFFRETLWDIERYYKLSMENKGLFSRKRAEQESLHMGIDDRFKVFNSSLLYGFFVRRYKGYSIYKIARRYYGIRSDRKALLEKEIQFVDVASQPPYLFTSESLDQVMKLVDQNGEDSKLQELKPHTGDFGYDRFSRGDVSFNRSLLPDGQFIPTEDGTLIDLNGNPVMDENGEPIQLEKKNPTTYAELSYLIARKGYWVLKRIYHDLKNAVGI